MKGIGTSCSLTLRPFGDGQLNDSAPPPASPHLVSVLGSGFPYLLALFWTLSWEASAESKRQVDSHLLPVFSFQASSGPAANLRRYLKTLLLAAKLSFEWERASCCRVVVATTVCSRTFNRGTVSFPSPLQTKQYVAYRICMRCAGRLDYHLLFVPSHVAKPPNLAQALQPCGLPKPC